MNELILYTAEDGRCQIKLRVDQQNRLIDPARHRLAFRRHQIEHLAASEENLSGRRGGPDGKNYRMQHYKLNAILVVGYRLLRRIDSKAAR